MEASLTTIAGMQISDLPEGLRLSSSENWNQTEKDWQILLDGKQNICLVAKVDEKVVGTTTAVIYENLIAWIGMVLVDREYRGRGISKKLLLETFDLLNDCPSIKLDATPAGHPVYRKLGFLDEYDIHRMTRMGKDAALGKHENTMATEPVKNENIEAVISLDNDVFGAGRGDLIRELVQNSQELCRVLKSGDHVTGFILGRRGSRFIQVGPVSAPDVQSAQNLIMAVLNDLGNSPIVVDVPAVQTELFRWLESIGFTRQRSFTRMYMGDNPYPGIPALQYLICGPEFG